ncbi:ABC transporter permease subunit [Sphaerisporangium rubeum]|uniref:ABC-type transport system involved in multi-copper enzyme maturation permease subunit n=1 Tax=Sphaerisporangium rubeum TaxID=321317 RepID=A0A7X0M3R1_9ACTN|nr:ABC transporter permease subunit [Sphaerisporangium rubeum]MBB6470883.1 ABC-type transport system involved in multi-copper enzyme maturation permease subunit [Sphaerisporangium rubeum]
MTGRTVATVAVLTLKEASRRRVLLAVAAMTAALLGLSAWGLSRLAVELAALTTGEARLVAAQVLNLVMFGFSLIAALGTAFLSGPTMAGEIESGTALSILARPIRRPAVLLGKWLGLVAFGAAFVVAAGLAEFLIMWATLGYWPPQAATGLALLVTQTTVLLTLALLLSTVISPMASGIVAVGLFGATWIAGVIGGLGQAMSNEGVARVGTVSRILLPTDGLWRGAMHAFQDPAALARFGGPAVRGGFPFLSVAPLTAAYLTWTVLWIALVFCLAAMAFARRDL